MAGATEDGASTGALAGVPAFKPAVARLEVLAAGAEAPRRAELVGAIESEPALALAVLAHSGCKSVPAAVDATPAATLAAIARSTKTADPLEPADPWLLQLRLHALAVRAVAERLAPTVGDDVDVLVAAALLHDFGKLALRAAAPGAYFDGRTPEARVAHEREAHGTDHAQVGAGALAEVGVHPELCTRIGGHHGDLPAAATLRLSDALCHYGHCHPVDVETLVAVSHSAGVGRAQLSELLFDLPTPIGPSSRALEPNPLSEREREVLRAISGGMSVKEIALSLELSASTVRNHLHRIYNRLGANDRAQAVLIATSLNWL